MPKEFPTLSFTRDIDDINYGYSIDPHYHLLPE